MQTIGRLTFFFQKKYKYRPVETKRFAFSENSVSLLWQIYRRCNGGPISRTIVT